MGTASSRHVDYFAALYVKKLLDNPAHFEVQISKEFDEKRLRRMGGLEMTAVPCGLAGCDQVFSRTDSARRHRKACHSGEPELSV